MDNAQWYMLAIVVSWVTAVRHPVDKRPRSRFTPRLRVVNGVTDINNQYPFIVSLETEESIHETIPFFRQCTGSLFTNQWVLTAAHCLDPGIKVVRYGDMSVPRKETKLLSQVLKQIPHPEYLSQNQGYRNNAEWLQNDIGLVHTKEIPMDRLGRIHTADYKTFIGRACRFAGFGLTSPNVDEMKLRDVIADEKRPLLVGEGLIRGELEGADAKISSPALAVVPKCGNSKQWPNVGDSGGPLVIDKKIVGVCTGGSSYDEKRYIVNYYTPVSPYIDWIRNNIKSNT
ncbi:serine protease 1-like [Plodia interpunctella]|uniref:serine protease 1-like n=1 Tax=Plodia interpunctella TaxID=58824 RepID=UPI002368F157|nr:serine protease 1-like [Plodia interpunctella]